MKINFEKVITLVVIGAFTATSINSFTAPSHPMTKEEAIEISKKAELVRDGLAAFGCFSFEATHYNSSWVRWMKRGHNSEMYLKVPEEHGVWMVIWTFRRGVPGGYTVIVIVDAETGTITHETTGVVFE